jgi:hypothetical protein
MALPIVQLEPEVIAWAPPLDVLLVDAVPPGAAGPVGALVGEPEGALVPVFPPVDRLVNVSDEDALDVVDKDKGKSAELDALEDTCEVESVEDEAGTEGEVVSVEDDLGIGVEDVVDGRGGVLEVAAGPLEAVCAALAPEEDAIEVTAATPRVGILTPPSISQPPAVDAGQAGAEKDGV